MKNQINITVQNFMQAGFKLLLFSMVLVLFQACAPQNKEDYMKDYEDFIQDVKQNYENFSEADWKTYDEKFAKYSGEYFKKFENDLQLGDKMLLGKYTMEYHFYRNAKTAKDVFDKVFENSDELKKKVEYYQEHEMQQDLEELQKEAEKMGGEAEKMLNDIMKELNEAK